MIIDCISDLHGYYPTLQEGDLLIVAGDLTARDTAIEHGQFLAWIDRQKYTKKILIAGNHDVYLEKRGLDHLKDVFFDLGIEYLCDSGTQFHGTKSNGEVCTMKLWGSPWTKTFPGINPKCKAFTCDTEEELAEKWALIPEDTDILITHGPPYGILDKAKLYNKKRCWKTGDPYKCVGSKSLQMQIFSKLTLKLFVCGHVHESYGMEPKGGFIENAVNASHVNENYKPVNKPIRVIL